MSTNYISEMVISPINSHLSGSCLKPFALLKLLSDYIFSWKQDKLVDLPVMLYAVSA